MKSTGTDKTNRGTERLSRTLPDYLINNLEIVFVGLNPGLYSAQIGHYYANKVNRFWNALSASGLIPDPMEAKDDWRLTSWGIGLTDIVKRPTSGIHEVSKREFRDGAKKLRDKVVRYSPRVVCFNGLTGYRVCCGKAASVGYGETRFGGARVFVIPSTSPRNARYSLGDITAALSDLKEFNEALRGSVK